MAWLFLPSLRNHRHEDSRATQRIAQFAEKADDYFAPDQLKQITPSERLSSALLLDIQVEENNSVGWVIIVAAAAAPVLLPRKARRALFPAWCLIVAAAIISFGGALTANSFGLETALKCGAFLLAFPGNGLALPWHFEGSVRAALSVLSGVVTLQSFLTDPLWMPYSWIWTILPPLRPFRGTARLSVLVALGTALPAAATLSHFIRRAPKRSKLAAASALAFLGIILAEYAVVPYPTFELHIPPAISALPPMERQSNPSNRVAPMPPVLEVPLDAQPASLLDQTAYQAPAFDGFLSRTPMSAYSEINGNAFLSLAFSGSQTAASLSHSPNDPKTIIALEAGLRELYRMGVRWVIVRPNRAGDEKTQLVESMLIRFGATRVSGGTQDAVIYCLQPRRPG